MICSKCGKENPEGSLFCNTCGTKILSKEINNIKIDNGQSEIQLNKRNVQVHKKLKLTIGIVCVLLILTFSITYGYKHYQSVQSENRENAIKKDIQNKITEAESYAKNNNYESAFKTLQAVIDKANIYSNSYDGLSKVVEEKRNEYDFRWYYTQALKDIDTKNYSDLRTRGEYLVNFYADKNEVKTDLFNKIVKLGENESNSDLTLLVMKFQDEYSEKSTKTNTFVGQDMPKEPSIGMTADEVRKSTWGNPQKVNQTLTANNKYEQWVYSSNRYIYFDNGIVTTIQK